MVYFAVTFPDSVILGVEVDHNNAELCRRNIEGLGDRCRLVEGAVWHLSGEVGYGGKKAWGIRIQAESPNRARAYTMPELLDMLGGADFVKMDIEGAEQEVLRDPRPWSSRVGAIRLEIHGPPYTAEECAETLASCGFQTEIEKGMCEYVTALRL
jgi:FkbM family methyltransferase